MSRTARLTALILISAAVVGCGGTASTPSPSSAAPTVSAAPTASPSTAPSAGQTPSALPSEAGSLGPFPVTGCPVAEPAFCAPASELAQAVVDRDSNTIVGLSRADTFRCAELDASIFPACDTADVLEGHPLGTARGTIEVYAAVPYQGELDALHMAIDPAYTDEAGDGRARVLGTSACGPDDPARRSYYIAWTAAREVASGAERLIGLYEFTFRDDGWRVGIHYVDTIEGWRIRHANPLGEIACGVAAWGSG